MAFTDDFTDADGTALEDHTPSGGTAWTLVSGSAGSAEINTNAVRAQAASPAVYSCDDQGSADQYVQVKQIDTGNNLYINCFCCVRLVDADNFIGYRQASFGPQMRLTKNVSGTTTDLITFSGAVNSTYKVEASGTTIKLFEDGAQVGSDQTVTDHQTETTQGFVMGDSRVNPFWDDFEAGALAGGTTVSVTMSSGATAGESNNGLSALLGSLSSGCTASESVSGSAAAGASIAESANAGDAEAKIADVLSSVSASASASATQSALSTMVGAISEGSQAGESWAADAQSLADLVGAASAGDSWSEGSIQTLQAALSAGTNAGTTFAESVQALASIAESATAAETLSALAVIAGALTNGATAVDVHSAITSASANFSAGATAGATFNYGDAVGYLTGVIVMEASLGATVSISPSLDGALTINPSLNGNITLN